MIQLGEYFLPISNMNKIKYFLIFHIYIYVVQEYSKLQGFHRVKGRVYVSQINAH